MSIGHFDTVDDYGVTFAITVYSKLCPQLLFVRIEYIEDYFIVNYFPSFNDTAKQKEFASKDNAIEFAEQNVKKLVKEYQAMYKE